MVENEKVPICLKCFKCYNSNFLKVPSVFESYDGFLHYMGKKLENSIQHTNYGCDSGTLYLVPSSITKSKVEDFIKKSPTS